MSVSRKDIKPIKKTFLLDMWTWMGEPHHYEPKSKEQNKEWKHRGSSPTKFKSAGK